MTIGVAAAYESGAGIVSEGEGSEPFAVSACLRQRKQVLASTLITSRRTLYRMLSDEGVAAQLRRMRIERAKAMLLHDPQRLVALVAFACGFDSESGFHRAFRAATAMTPAEYRRHCP